MKVNSVVIKSSNQNFKKLLLKNIQFQAIVILTNRVNNLYHKLILNDFEDKQLKLDYERDRYLLFYYLYDFNIVIKPKCIKLIKQFPEDDSIVLIENFSFEPANAYEINIL